MANEVLQKQGTLIAFGVSSFAPSDPGTQSASTITALLTLSGVSTGTGRQSDKIDFGSTHAAQYALIGCVDFTGETPSATGQIDYYWLPSTVSTQAEGNVGANSGADGAAPDGATSSYTLTTFIKQALPIGSLFTHAGGVVQNGYVGKFPVPTQYGQLLVVNNGGTFFEADDVEAHQVLVPIVDEIQ